MLQSSNLVLIKVVRMAVGGLQHIMQLDLLYNVGMVDKVAKKNTANIILYKHSKGNHYAALRWNGAGYLAYNVSGSDDVAISWGKSISANLKKNSRTLLVLISISK